MGAAVISQPPIAQAKLPPFTRTRPTFWQPSWPSFEARFDGKRSIGVTLYRGLRLLWVAILMPVHLFFWTLAALRLSFLVPDSALPGRAHGWNLLQRLFYPPLKRSLWSVSDIGAGPDFSAEQERAGCNWRVRLLQRVFRDGAHALPVEVNVTKLETEDEVMMWIRDEAVDPRGIIKPGDVPLFWLGEARGNKRVIMYLVGGGYVAGNPLEGNRCFVLAHRTGLPVVGPNYRKAGVKERAYPAALQDAIVAYAKLLELGYTDIILAGDSAGGGLAVALLLYLNKLTQEENGRPSNLLMPTGLLLYSPWVDLTLETARNGLTAGHDDLINPSMSYLSSMQYMATVGDPSISSDPSSPFSLGPFHPFFSPALPSARPALARLAQSYSKESPLRVLMYSSAAEILGPESRRLADNLKEVAGIRLEFHEEPGEVHCFPLIPTWISPAAKKALDRIEVWLKEEQTPVMPAN